MPPYPLQVKFFSSASGVEPVRDWLHKLPKEDRITVGEDIRTVQIGWPLGMSLVRKLETDLWELRVSLAQGIARVLFTLVNDNMVLLHGFIKKSQKTPKNELALAINRLKQIRDKV